MLDQREVHPNQLDQMPIQIPKVPNHRPGPQPFALQCTSLLTTTRDSMLGLLRREGGWYVLGDDGAKACVRFFAGVRIYGATTGIWKIELSKL
jgi:hypothetical protein